MCRRVHVTTFGNLLRLSVLHNGHARDTATGGWRKRYKHLGAGGTGGVLFSVVRPVKKWISRSFDARKRWSIRDVLQLCQRIQGDMEISQLFLM